jgi:hypothetical protein
MKRTSRTKNGLLAATAAVFLMTLVIPAFASTAQAAPVPLGVAPSQQWAYGAERWMNASQTLPNATYSVHAFFGWQVVVTATNTSATSVAIEAQRTVGASVVASFCAPNCGSPKVLGNMSLLAWERDTGFANFTTNASVTENGTSVAALGLLNASAESSGLINQSLSLQLSMGNVTRSASSSLSAHGHSSASISFAPALGLIPWSVAPNATWNSSSAFTAQGAWSAFWTAQHTGFNGATVTASGAPSGSVSGNGTLVLQGADLGTITLQNGQTVPVIALQVDGPFDLMDGFILVPHAFDLFGGGPHDWDARAIGVVGLATTKVDLFMDAIHHRAEVTAAASNAEDANQGLMSTVPASGPSPAAAGTGNSAELQAQPEAVPVAQQQSRCLVNGCGSTGAAGQGAALLPLLLVGLVVAAVIGTVAVVEWRVWSKRRSEHGLAPSYGTVPAPGMPPAGASGMTAVPPPPTAPAGEQGVPPKGPA